MRFLKVLCFSMLPTILLFALIEGVSQLYWIHLENEAFNTIATTGEKVLRNDGINFMKQPDGVVGYRLRPNVPHFTNSQGFAQIEIIERNRLPRSVRVVSVGESTTQGSNLTTNYPYFLLQILRKGSQEYHKNPEVLNAGVSGWMSDQWAAFSENQLTNYFPDVVIIYGGWNDFQYYDPFNGVPKVPFFKSAYGTVPMAVGYLKSVTLGSAILKKIRTANAVASTQVPTRSGREKSIYHFLFKNMAQTVKSFQKINPNVKIVVSSLVGRWPMDTDVQFWDKFGHVGWMAQNRVGRQQAALFVKSLNKELQQFAMDHGLIFVDMAKVFSTLDRQRLMRDFCHMTGDGYKIMAGTFYEELNRRHIIRGKENKEHDRLVRKYTINSPQTIPPNKLVLNQK